MPHVDVSHQVISTTHPDEAESLAGYLTEHGIFAFVAEELDVRVASPDLESDTLIRMLKATWRLFWENSDSGIFGLPLFIKEH